MERRALLRMGALVGALAAVGTVPVRARAAYDTLSLEQVRRMTPLQMAEASGTVMTAWQSVQNHVSQIRNPEVRASVSAILTNPAPQLMRRIGHAEKKEIYAELVAKGYLADIQMDDFLPATSTPDTAPQPFYSAPGSGYMSHHAYPGGLATHTDLNVRVSTALADGYATVYSYALDRDVVLASQLLHDLHKPWVFQWHKDGTARTEMKLAGTGEHHPLGIAESITRGIPAEVVVAQACAHNHPRTADDEAQVVGWIKAAGIISGVDPVRYGLLEADGKTLPLPRRQEGFVCHLGDHDWVLTVPAAQWSIPVLARIAERDYGIAPGDATGNAFRNYVFSQYSIMGVYEVYAARGEAEVIRMVHALIDRA